MYEELVKRLRDEASRRSPCSAVGLMCGEAADAIEQLERENNFLKSMQRSLVQGRSPEDLAYMIHRNMR